MAKRHDILVIIMDYAEEHSGNSPDSGDLLRELRKKGWRMHKSTLREHLDKLFIDKLVDRVDGKLVVIDSKWYRPSEVPNRIPSP